MDLDLRLPMGMMFAMTGAVLLAFGLATRTQPQFYVRSLGINADLWWGVVMLIFGIVLVGMGRRGQGAIELRKQGRPTGTKKPKRR